MIAQRAREGEPVNDGAAAPGTERQGDGANEVASFTVPPAISTDAPVAGAVGGDLPQRCAAIAQIDLMENLREDLAEILIYTSRAHEHCTQVLRVEEGSGNNDTQRDLHHLAARIESMIQQWEDSYRLVDRLLERAAPGTPAS